VASLADLAWHDGVSNCAVAKIRDVIRALEAQG
jgi:hypothetical protein